MIGIPFVPILSMVGGIVVGLVRWHVFGMIADVSVCCYWSCFLIRIPVMSIYSLVSYTVGLWHGDILVRYLMGWLSDVQDIFFPGRTDPILVRQL